MTELLNINPLAEVMFYYWGKANNCKIEKRLAEAVRRHSKQKQTLKKLIEPALALEKLLDSNLTANNLLVSKYFKNFNDTHSTHIDSCLAFMMIYACVVVNSEWSADKISGYFHGLDRKTQMQIFRLGLSKSYEITNVHENETIGVLHCIDNLDLPVDDKYQILSTAYNYDTCIDELFSLLMPAAKLVESAIGILKPAIDEFFKLYSELDEQTFLQTISNMNFKVQPISDMRIAPLILGFDKLNFSIAMKPLDDKDNPCKNKKAVCNILLGIGKHIVKEPAHYDTATLGEKLKILSDSTRLEILFYLCSCKAYGQELSDKFGINPSTVSYHTVKLTDAGFLTAEVFGGRTYYEANKAGIQRMLDSFAEKIK